MLYYDVLYQNQVHNQESSLRSIDTFTKVDRQSDAML